MWAQEVAQRARRWLPLEPPIDIEAFAAGIGARHIVRTLPADVLGFMFERRQLWLVTQRGLEPEQRRMTVLHEGGHALMHNGNCQYVASQVALWADKNEKAADVFAAEYGIPDELVWRCESVGEMAAESGLPVALCELRLKMLHGASV